jgi:two-component system, cell cycle response regulator
MSAKVLVVDDMPANVRLLQAKLEADYYEVLIAYEGKTAIELAILEQPDIILLDVMMPGMNGYEVTRHLKGHEDTRHIPIILVTALDGRDDRLSGLEAGADDFLTKPLDDIVMFSRLRALVRLKQLSDELRQREASGRRVGLFDNTQLQRQMTAPGNVLVVDDNERQGLRLMSQLGEIHRSALETDPVKALKIASGRVDLLVINLMTKAFDALRFIAQLRSNEATRHTPILGIYETDDRKSLLKALELGVTDVLPRPVDSLELIARAKTQIRRKRYADFLRNSLDRSLELAVTDALTGLNNRRYMDMQLASLLQRHIKTGETVSVLVADIDFFKKVNDTYGHDAGDEILKEFAKRLAINVRAIDMPCRMGGEEFVVIMPDTDLLAAEMIAERVRLAIAADSFDLGGMTEINVTVSVGVSTLKGLGDTIEGLLKRADEAVYEAKQNGRNQVILNAA